ncbi:hypothetical protein [Paucibacter sp. KBW04]|uniref:hypothetical protein n=1 Tax=Paucibacter sp. KBW04 TaxID=2153361 RepID=UPI000F588B70|nr:hypothetical protein [Paucibacter sp. KBW04]
MNKKSAASRSPLGNFIAAIPTEDKTAFANEVGSDIAYLYQVAGKKDPNPTLRLAMSLHTVSKKWARKLHIPALSFEDLLVGKPMKKLSSEHRGLEVPTVDPSMKED